MSLVAVRGHGQDECGQSVHLCHGVVVRVMSGPADDLAGAAAVTLIMVSRQLAEVRGHG